MRESGVEPLDQLTCRDDARSVARAAFFQQGIGFGEVGGARQIVGQETPHPVYTQRIVLDARKNIARHARHVADAFGDLWRADRTHGDFETNRQRFGIGQEVAGECDLAACGAALVEPRERLSRRQ